MDDGVVSSAGDITSAGAVWINQGFIGAQQAGDGNAGLAKTASIRLHIL